MTLFTVLLTITILTILMGIIILMILVLKKVSKKEEAPVLIDEEKQRLKIEVEKISQDRQRQEGELKQLIQQSATLKAEIQAQLQIERIKNSELQNKVNRFEHDQIQRDTETDRKINDLNQSTKALAQERERIIADEKNKRIEDEENRSRIWNDHEQEAIRLMNEVCRKQEFLFNTYENNNLPDEFDKSFKPDFMIRFLQQYIIFDAKLSKGDINNYITGQVKKTVEKIKESPACNTIYKTVFFVIPSFSIPQMNKLSYYEAGYRFYVIPVEAFEPIIASYKKLEDYDLADKYDPQERENVINLIAAFDHHIRRQNAVNILNTVDGINVLKEAEDLPQDISGAVDERRKKIRLPKHKENELRRLIKEPLEQIKEIEKMIHPALAEIGEESLIDAVEFSTIAMSQEKAGKTKMASKAKTKTKKSTELDFS